VPIESPSAPDISRSFDVLGFRFRIISAASSSSAQTLAGEFQFFQSEDDAAGLRIELCTEPPPYAEAPDAVATNYTPRNVSFSLGDTTWLDYGGRALAVWDRAAGVFRVSSEDPDLQYEAAYLFLLSQIGEALDERGLHRIHAVALEYQGRAVLAVFPMGGGKSTLGAAMLRFPEIGFLSDDSPFISPAGRVHAFPLRMGLLPGYEGSVPPELRRTIHRMEFGPKVLIDYDYFAHRVRASAEPGIVFLGRRSFGDACRIEPASPGERYRSILADCVVGLGLFQGVEFVLRHSPMQILGKVGVAWSRFRVAQNLFRRSEVYRLVLGRDSARNAETVFQFVQQRLGGSVPPAGQPVDRQDCTPA
jgi:hypothetical protein